ncbi:hypothetical protein TcarDRAFT_0159 [Thermosinus carboxydivorans Nor1]|uniref:6-phosphogluconate dehydrogenase NADP-binding domain-containing protein n=1 Tax=Thermosinus carboxydivorans Nor1 TaxID=401526 RepID=A1HU69_9FIRM|nr:NAD(P)-binding domain-containing protein [Thermosinus carboxydivorans]EAX46412.1 hypothetical protein TcarDRAFT_0159 [Thermosinus carboxydivorans Nor1]
MRIGLVGVGRMGKVLAARLAKHVELRLFDHNTERLQAVRAELGVATVDAMGELAELGTVILAVPDREVISCLKEFNTIKKELNAINIATNVAQHVLEETAAKHIRCIGVKFVGHAGEMALGQDPVIIINERPPELVPLARQIFEPVGTLLVGKADLVTYINTVAGEKALEAGVMLEEQLRLKGITDPVIIKSAVRQVAAGILKAYADDDLGPFAREIVRAVRARLKAQGAGLTYFKN